MSDQETKVKQYIRQQQFAHQPFSIKALVELIGEDRPRLQQLVQAHQIMPNERGHSKPKDDW